MTAPKRLSEWHCTHFLASWPGCGRCADCLDIMPEVFADARALLAELQRVEALLVVKPPGPSGHVRDLAKPARWMDPSGVAELPTVKP